MSNKINVVGWLSKKALRSINLLRLSYTLVIPIQTSNEKDILKGQLYLAQIQKATKSIIKVYTKGIGISMARRGGCARGFHKIRLFDLQFGEAIFFNGSRSLRQPCQ